MAEIAELSLSPSAYYRFNSGALTTDSSGNAVTLTNTNSVGEAGGRYGTGADFGSSNTNKLFLANTDLGIGGGACSVACWVKLSAQVTSGAVGYCFIQQEDAGTHTRQEIRYFYNGGTLRISYSRVKMNIAGQGVNVNTTLNVGEWYHLAYTYDGTNVRGYLNGVLQGTTAASGDGAAVGVDGIKIGAGDDGSTIENWTSGIIDDAGFWNRALTQNEITSLYEDGAESHGVTIV